MNLTQFLSFLVLIQFNCLSQTVETLDIVSWNVFLRPSFLKDNQMGRVDSIGNYLIETDADILVLQEVFHRKSRKQLTKYLNETFPFHTSVGPTSFFGISSGVMIFSKHKIKAEKHISFKRARGSDRMAKKGAVLAVVEVRDKEVQIIGTHLQSGMGEKKAGIRRKQVLRLKQLEEQNDVNAIFVGDFNITWNSMAYIELLSDLNCMNDTLSGEYIHTANFAGQKLYDPTQLPRWIDFILVNNSSLCEFLGTQIEQPLCEFQGEKCRISDHNPIRSTIRLK